MARQQGPLAGLKVVEMAGIGPCPLAGQLLADLGADVVIVDRHAAKADPTDINRRGKRSVALNLKSDDGLEAAKAIIAGADILIEGFRPGVMERLGLGPEDFATTNAGLIYGRMTGWGQTGPRAQTAGHDINYLAITGILHAIGTKERSMPPLNMVADYGAGTMFLLLGVLAALFERGRSSKGQVIDAAMSDAAPLLAGLVQGFVAQGQWSEERQSNLLDGGAPFYRCYTCADGKEVAIGPLEPQFFAELCAKAEIEGDASTQYDRSKWDSMHARYEALFATKTRAQWTAIFEDSDACLAPVLAWSEAPDEPHNVARNTFFTRDGVTQTSPAPRFNRTPADPRPAAPRAVGEDGETVLSETGYSSDQIAAMRANHALL
jgi:alpha-methylacyl-CoA racemase